MSALARASKKTGKGKGKGKQGKSEALDASKWTLPDWFCTEGLKVSSVPEAHTYCRAQYKNAKQTAPDLDTKLASAVDAWDNETERDDGAIVLPLLYLTVAALQELDERTEAPARENKTVYGVIRSDIGRSGLVDELGLTTFQSLQAAGESREDSKVNELDMAFGALEDAGLCCSVPMKGANGAVRGMAEKVGPARRTSANTKRLAALVSK